MRVLARVRFHFAGRYGVVASMESSNGHLVLTYRGTVGVRSWESVWTASTPGLNIAEPAGRRAWAVFWHFQLSTPAGYVIGAVIAVLGGWAGVVYLPDDWPDALRVVSPVVAVMAWAVVAMPVVALGALVRQRDEARRRLREIRRTSREYRLVPVRAWSAPLEGQGDLLRLEVRNEGRGARFAVVMEELRGTEEELLDPHTHLYWMGRRGVLDEEIPPGEERLVGLGFVQPNLVQQWLVFTPADPSGKPWGRSYQAAPGEVVIWLRISTRGLPELGYSRLIGVSARWDGSSGDVFYDLEPDPPGTEAEVHSPAFAHLLDWDDEQVPPP